MVEPSHAIAKNIRDKEVNATIWIEKSISINRRGDFFWGQ
ncbi:unnamed protein product, partial [Rotaria socialis]